MQGLRLLLDTHVLVWLMEGDGRLPHPIRQQIFAATNDDRLFVSAITPWEIAMLEAKGRLRLNLEIGAWLDAALGLPGIRLEPLSPRIAVAANRLPGEPHGDPADRILMATARHLDAALVTIDDKIIEYGSQGWMKCLALG